MCYLCGWSGRRGCWDKTASLIGDYAAARSLVLTPPAKSPRPALQRNQLKHIKVKQLEFMSVD